jgi:transcriptional regulator with XRE-family HTH domain
MSQAELGTASNISWSQIQSYELGKISIPVVILIRIATILQVKAVDLLTHFDFPLQVLDELGVNLEDADEFAKNVAVQAERRIALVTALISDIADSSNGEGVRSPHRANDG